MEGTVIMRPALLSLIGTTLNTNTTPSTPSTSIVTPQPAGSAFYTATGSHDFVAPAWVSTVHVLAIGGGKGA